MKDKKTVAIFSNERQRSRDQKIHIDFRGYIVALA